MKKKIFMLSLVACLVVLSIAGTSLAYFTDTDAKSNVFTSGNVYIELDYEAYNENPTRLYPGKSYAGASIENTGTENAYIGAIITVTVPTGTDFAKISTIFGGFNGNSVKYVATETGYTVYVVVEDELATGNSSVTIFSKMSFPEDWGNDEMAAFFNLNVNVTAYGVQTVGFSTATEALTTAFDTWASYPTN